MLLRMQNKNLLVSPIVQDRTKSGLFLSAEQDDFAKGTITESPSGSSFKQGTVVHYLRYSATITHLQDRKFHLLKEEDILAVEDS